MATYVQQYVQHLTALRQALMGCLGALIVGIGVMACALPWLSQGLLYPLKTAGRMLGQEATGGLISTQPMGVFSVLMQLCFFGGLGISAPGMLYCFGKFVLPALKPDERKLALPALGVALLLFGAGASLSFFFLLPTTLAVSMKLNAFLGFELLWSAADYYGLVVWVTLALGFAFEFPLLLFFAAYWNWVSVQKLRELRRVLFVVFLVIAALINPSGDPLAMLVIGGIMHGLYEVAVVCADYKRRQKIRLASGV